VAHPLGGVAQIEKIKVKPCPTLPLPRNPLLNICRTGA
jgi:hypothetical protein